MPTREEYARNPQKHIQQTIQYRKRKQTLLNSIKAESGCITCGEKDPIVLEFHHTDPATKHPTIKHSSATKRSLLHTLGWDTMLKEIDKCVVLCANCHRRVEWRKIHG